MSDVKRYNIGINEDDNLERENHSKGDYVLYSDYEKLKAENEVLKGLYAHSENVAFERLKRLEYLNDEARNSGKFAQDQEDKLAKLTRQLSILKTAHKKIAKVKYGLEIHDTDEYLLEHWSKQALNYESISREALKECKKIE